MLPNGNMVAIWPCIKPSKLSLAFFEGVWHFLAFLDKFGLKDLALAFIIFWLCFVFFNKK